MSPSTTSFSGMEWFVFGLAVDALFGHFGCLSWSNDDATCIGLCIGLGWLRNNETHSFSAKAKASGGSMP
jgi:hypothetical protein